MSNVLQLGRQVWGKIKGSSPSALPEEADRDTAPVKAGPSPTYKETQLVRLVDERYQAAAEAKQPHEDRYLEAYSFFQGDQWVRADKGRVSDSRHPKRRDRSYATVNKIRPNARKHVSRALSARVSVSVSPLTSRPLDVDTAAQARALLAHFGIIHDDDDVLFDCIEQAVEVGPVWVLDYWDEQAIVPLPKLDVTPQLPLQLYDTPAPHPTLPLASSLPLAPPAASSAPVSPFEIADVVDMQAGEVASDIFSCHECFPDPTAKTPDRCQWMITQRKHSVSWVRSRHPEVGQFIGADDGTDGSGSLDEAEASAGNVNGSGSGREVVVKTLWELPSGIPDTPGYFAGRYVVTAGGRVLQETEYPYKKMVGRQGVPELPFTCLMFEKRQNTIWGNNAITPLLPLQRTTNRLITKLERQASNGDGKILAPRGCEIREDAFKSGEENEVVFYTVDSKNLGGLKPEFMPAAPLDPTIPQVIQMLERAFDEIGEVGDISRGESPWAGAAAAAIQALQDADASTAAPFTQRIKKFCADRARKRLSLAQEHYDIPRLIMVQDSDDDNPAERAELFVKFSPGRFVVTAAASAPQTPAMRVQTILDLQKAGGFLPENLPATMLLLEALGVELSDKVTEDLRQLVGRALAERMQRAEAESLKAAAAGANPAPLPALQESVAGEG